VRTTIVIRVSANGEFDVSSVERTLAMSPVERVLALIRKPQLQDTAIVFVGDGISGNPLDRFPKLAAKCRARGISISVRTVQEHEHAEAQWQLQHTRRRLESPNSDAVIDAAARAGPRHAPPLPGTEALVRTFVRAEDLPGPASSARPGGPMAALLGDRVAAEALTYGDEPLDPVLATRVRAWLVPSLIGTAFVAADEADIARALEVHVQGILGVPVLIRRDQQPMAYRKYMHVHVSAPTPPDSSTGQPMFLELYGPLAIAAEYDLRTVEGAAWQQKYRPRVTVLDEPAELPGPLVFWLSAATWANISYPGVDVPFYM
jgi:hypothetical protein